MHEEKQTNIIWAPEICYAHVSIFYACVHPWTPY